MIVVGVIGVCAVLLAIQFKNLKPEYGIYISVAGCIMIFMTAISYIEDIVYAIEEFANLTSIGKDYIKIMLKIAGISFVCEISSDIAKDCGYSSIANHVQIFGKITVLVISLPVFVNLISSIGKLLT